jgi:hypothetical protein
MLRSGHLVGLKDTLLRCNEQNFSGYDIIVYGAIIGWRLWHPTFTGRETVSDGERRRRYSYSRYTHCI